MTNIFSCRLWLCSFILCAQDWWKWWCFICVYQHVPVFSCCALYFVCYVVIKFILLKSCSLAEVASYEFLWTCCPRCYRHKLSGRLLITYTSLQTPPTQVMNGPPNEYVCISRDTSTLNSPLLTAVFSCFCCEWSDIVDNSRASCLCLLWCQFNRQASQCCCIDTLVMFRKYHSFRHQRGIILYQQKLEVSGHSHAHWPSIHDLVDLVLSCQGLRRWMLPVVTLWLCKNFSVPFYLCVK